METRSVWAAEKVSWVDKWETVVFSDEKKFNLDGPDGNQYYWHDLRKEPQYFSKRQMGGGSCMVWGAFGYHGTSEIVFISGRQRSTNYVNTLEMHLLPFGDTICGHEWIFQQDNASIHSSHQTKTWLEENRIEVLDWPARSPDLNPIENIWGIIVRDVYVNGRQFRSINELREAITKSLASIPKKILQNLITSMHKRLIKVIKKNGRFIGY